MSSLVGREGGREMSSLVGREGGREGEGGRERDELVSR